jgi:hypothetical protein
VLSAALLFILLIVALIVSKLLRGRNASVRFKIAALVPDPNTGQGEELISESFELRPGGQLRLSSDPMWTNAWGAPELPTKYISCWKTSAFGGRQLILADSDGPASIPLNDLQEVEASRPDGSSVKLRIMIMPPAVSSKKG